MATILLSAAGAMFGAGFGGTVLGLSGAVIGRAVGATIGRMIDQQLLGGGSQAVEMGRIDRFRLTGASEGAPVPRIWGRMRVPGQVIWAGPFREISETRGGGKGPPKPKVTEYSYTVSMAVALCEGEILRVGRVWADGAEVAIGDLNMRVYTGCENQEADPMIEAYEGLGMVPAYRGIAYAVFEDLPLAAYGNRVPQLTFEVVRKAQTSQDSLSEIVRGVALIPGTGEYALATTPVQYDMGLGELVPANQHSPSGGTNMTVSLEALREELPECRSVSLVVSWFGSDLRCGECRVKPKVEQNAIDGNSVPWSAGGVVRNQAETIARIDDRPVYGGTPSDSSVMEAIRAMRSAGQQPMFYPFILMEQLEGNALPDPYGLPEQPIMPWRGRITCSIAPGAEGSPDGTSTVRSETDAFFGTAQPGDFSTASGAVVYTGSDDWGYRRMILHYAHLCKLAGGVASFCIGSELVGLTTIRAENNSFPVVEQLRQLAADCRAILGADCKIGYAADWSEYFGFHPGNGDVFFHLDSLWADDNIDFVGIDNYLPLSDWRDGETHADSDAGSIYDLEYLRKNVCGGEYYDWYYASPANRERQIRTAITDGALGQDWIFRVKDLRGWWSNAHRNRINGQQQAPTPWIPGMKPIWFTELGCAALDKGTNQPNKFLDRYSSESRLPWYSDGSRDDLIQMQYLRAILGYWGEARHNPRSEVYDGRMIDLGRAHVWSWDARPFPQFPARSDVWSDGEAYARGHWLNGRATNQALSDVVQDICQAAGVVADVRGLHGVVRGFSSNGGESGRAALQPLMLAYGFDAVEREGRLIFRMRSGRVDAHLGPETLALGDENKAIAQSRAPEAELVGRIRLCFVEAEGDYETRAVEAILPDERLLGAAKSELALVMTAGEARHISHRWLAESRLAQDNVTLTVPPSLSHIGAGDVVALPAAEGKRRYRVDRVDCSGAATLEAVRVEPQLYRQTYEADLPTSLKAFTPAVPVYPVFMDLPLLTGQEVPYAPHLAVTARPWPGSVAVFGAVEAEGGYALNTLFPSRAMVGQTLSSLACARPGVLDRGAPLRIRLAGGNLSSATQAAFLSGANLMAIGDGSAENWEVFQFLSAKLVSPTVWELSGRLRGQAGTEAVMPEEWPAGSTVVLLNAAVRQINLAQDAVGLARHYRIGPAKRPWDDPTYVERNLAFAGIGQRPYAPCHLRAMRSADGRLDITWVRRTRIGGDSWNQPDVPVSETGEAYLIRLIREGKVIDERKAGKPEISYNQAELEELGALAPFEVHIAQLSESFGPGAFRRIEING